MASKSKTKTASKNAGNRSGKAVAKKTTVKAKSAKTAKTAKSAKAAKTAKTVTTPEWAKATRYTGRY